MEEETTGMGDGVAAMVGDGRGCSVIVGDWRGDDGDGQGWQRKQRRWSVREGKGWLVMVRKKTRSY